MLRTCRACRIDKPALGFYGRATECKVCHLARKRDEYAADPERFKARVRSYQHANPESVAATRRKTNQGEKAAARARRGNLAKHHITEVEYDEVFISQDERCGICRSDKPGRFWCIDHNHACCDGPTSCGRCIRGILCWHCNVALGHFRDDRATLIAAAQYLDHEVGIRSAARDVA